MPAAVLRRLGSGLHHSLSSPHTLQAHPTMVSAVLLCCAALALPALGFAPAARGGGALRRPALARASMAREPIEIEFELPKKGITEYGTVQMKLPPMLENSEAVVVRYELPFGLNAAPEKHDYPWMKCVVSKDGEGGEKVGDVLRFTTAFPNGKAPIMYDVCAAGGRNMDAVVAALTSNKPSVTEEIVMVFERPVAGPPPPARGEM